MSKIKSLQQRLSIRESRQNSKLQRLLRFIQQHHGPVKSSIHENTSNSTHHNIKSIKNNNYDNQQTQIKTKRRLQRDKSNKTSRLRTMSKQKQKCSAHTNKDSKNKDKSVINEAVQSYLQKVTMTKFQNVLQIKTRQKQKVKQIYNQKNRSNSQQKYQQQQEGKDRQYTNRLMKHEKTRKYDLLPSIKIVKTQQTKIMKDQNQYKFRQLVEGKKYESLLLLPHHILQRAAVQQKSRKAGGQKEHETSHKYIQNIVKTAKVKTSGQYMILPKYEQNKTNRYKHQFPDEYTGWQIADQYLQQLEHNNLY